MLENELLIREPRISLFRRVLVAVGFGIFFLIIAFVYHLTLRYSFTSGDLLKIILYIILLFIVFITSLVPIIIRHVIHIKFNELKIKHSHELGIWTYHEKWQDLEGFEYISVFKVAESYQVNLWYEDKSILNLFVIENFEDAIENAYQISVKLNVDLLDASVKGNHRWVDKNLYAENSKIVHLQ